MVHILTFQNALNYGAALQCAALYKTISKISPCDVIDYRAPEIEKTYMLFSLRRPIKKNIRGMLLMKKTIAKRKKFNAFFEANIKLTRPFKSVDEMLIYPWQQDDVFCVGSDQVWNPDLTGNDDAYMFNFAPGNLVKISYAASLGREMKDEELQLLKKKLAGFNCISVREKSACAKMKAAGINCIQNIDPVYLLDKEEWEKMSVRVKEEDVPFILVYLLQKSPQIMEKAQAYAKKTKKRLVIITELAIKKIPGAVYVETAAPNEFIRYFLKADMIFTNSFHGLSLSVILNKPFAYGLLEGKKNTNSRLQNLVGLFNLERQNCVSYSEISYETPIDYSTINQTIASEGRKAQEYLTKSITATRSVNVNQL